jgi:hypothetical protein
LQIEYPSTRYSMKAVRASVMTEEPEVEQKARRELLLSERGYADSFTGTILNSRRRTE